MACNIIIYIYYACTVISNHHAIIIIMIYEAFIQRKSRPWLLKQYFFFEKIYDLYCI